MRFHFDPLRACRRVLSAVAALSIAAGASAQTAPAPAAATPGPALWKLSDEDTTIYLFGTIHMLPKELDWRTPALERSIGEADELVLETAFGTDLRRTRRTMKAMAHSPGLPPLLDRVPEDKRDVLGKLIKASGLSAATLDRMETWAAAMTLFATTFHGMGFKAEAGVEQGLTADFRDKPVTGLETVEQQFGFFDTLSEESQRAFLTGSIDDPAVAKAQFEAMVAAWAAGDVDQIARTFDAETALSPELRRVLMTERNRKWAEWLDGRLDKPGTVLVAVGAGHLAGRDSVQTMLERRGLKAERLQ